VASINQPLTLCLALSTDLHRGVVTAPPPTSSRKKKHTSTSSVSAAPSAASAGGAGSRKKKGVATEEVERTAAQLLFGKDAPRYQLVQLRILKEQVIQLSASIASLRHALSRPSPPLASDAAEASEPAIPAQSQLAFFELLLDIQCAFFMPLASIPGVSDDSPKPTLANLPAYRDWYGKRFGLEPALKEVEALERVFDWSSEAGGATQVQSNGICMFLHQFSEDSTRRQAEAEGEQIATATAAAAAAAGQAATTGKGTLRSRTPNRSPSTH
jgi:hypothetical protein